MRLKRPGSRENLNYQHYDTKFSKRSPVRTQDFEVVKFKTERNIQSTSSEPLKSRSNVFNYAKGVNQEHLDK